MRQLAGLSLFLTRVLLCSLLALGCQIYLAVRHSDMLLVVQEWVKQGSVRLFEEVHVAAAYRVAYNILNGDGIVVHTFFVLCAFLALYLLMTPVRFLARVRR